MKKLIPDALCVILFALIAFLYFYPADLEGRRLTAHDNTAADGLSVEIQNYRSQHNGETPRWINSIFGGMPTYQVAPSYNSTRTLDAIGNAYHLWLPDYVWYIFASMLGFYILLRAFDFRQWMAALGAIIWAFSSYFFIIIAAGHIWKVITLTYIPPTIAGVVLLFRGKYLWGAICTAIFAALQILSNHVQMTYYFLIPEIALFIAFLVQARREKQMPAFWKATGILVVAAVLAIALNASNLYHTYEYSKDTMRGKSELVKAGADRANQTDSGLERDYITAWSYGIYETWSLLIPNVNGGASVPLSENKTAMKHSDARFRQAGIYQAFTQYWGEQPMTSGPVYVGAFVCVLFLLSLIIIPNRNPVKWALLAATILSVFLAWGKNWMWFTNLFIDHVPMYAKFRTVSSILVVAEFTIPLLAMLGLKEFVQGCQDKQRRPSMLRALVASTGVALFFCIVFALAPTLTGDCVSSMDRHALSSYVSQGYFDQMTATSIIASISTMRAAMLSADAWRSAIIILIGSAILYWYFRRTITSITSSEAKSSLSSSPKGEARLGLLLLLLLVLCLVDLWDVNKRYLNDGMFTRPQTAQTLQKTPADEYILDKSGNKRDYRVLNLTVSPFNDNTTSYFYSSVGGYHPAKLRRYQELIEQHIGPEIQNINQALQDSTANAETLFPVLNMLNTRWFILGNAQQQYPYENEAAYGNAWFVDSVVVVQNANEEIDALHHHNPRTTAIVSQDFAGQLPASLTTQTSITTHSSSPHGEVRQGLSLTSLTSTTVSYKTENDHEALAVFSQIYYPGWEATIDGKPAPIIRADYVLRAMLIPAGTHVIQMTFNPSSVQTTETIAYIALAILAIALILLIILQMFKKKKAGGMFAATLICGASVFTACSNNDDSDAEKGQLLEVYDVQGSAGKARLTVNGKVLFVTDVYVGKNGLGKTGEGDGKTPVGILHPLSAFGVKPNPGTTMPYIDVKPTTYACDEDCEYYNKIIDIAKTKHECKGEEMYSYQPQYNYGIATDFNKECIYPNGSAIFIHVKGSKPYTGGCIAFDEDRMVEILKNCDMSLVIKVME